MYVLVYTLLLLLLFLSPAPLCLFALSISLSLCVCVCESVFVCVCVCLSLCGLYVCACVCVLYVCLVRTRHSSCNHIVSRCSMRSCQYGLDAACTGPCTYMYVQVFMNANVEGTLRGECHMDKKEPVQIITANKF